jgi:hypothetical protein
MMEKRASSDSPIPSDLIKAKEMIFDPCGFHYTQPKAESESTEYGACTFSIHGLSVRYRVAKITPTKIGQFVTLWRRSNEGITQPFESSDDLDLAVISTRYGDRLGQFVFPKPVLLAKGIISDVYKEGKRGFRVYPPWDMTNNKQAQKTQEWQLAYFIEIMSDGSTDIQRARTLYLQ